MGIATSSPFLWEAVAILLLGMSHVAAAQTESVLYSFDSNGIDGFEPYAGVAVDSNGNVYGTTCGGGGPSDRGAVFEVSPTGDETLLYDFTWLSGADPCFGETVILDQAGNIYGTTSVGGTNGVGTVFKLAQNGEETMLHSFAQNGIDGYSPTSGVAVDSVGNLYGTTNYGGVYDLGAVYKLAPDGTETVLHSFKNDGRDGCHPYGAVVVRGKESVLYGTAQFCGANGAGIVFRLTQAGKETVLHTFSTDGTDGYFPEDGVIFDEAGNIYGTTVYGGESGDGTVFKISMGHRTETVLHSFARDGTDGYHPYAGLVRGKGGILYGTTVDGGAADYGTVFELTLEGTETVLHSFAPGGADGTSPVAGVTVGKTGVLYGTTIFGGTYNWGAVYKIVP